jgi:hypothetical protein
MYYTSLEENTFEGSISIGPNPAVNGKSKVIVSLSPENEYSLSVHDISGRMVHSRQLSHGSQVIDLAPGQPGIYIVRLSQNGEPVVAEKLVVN